MVPIIANPLPAFQQVPEEKVDVIVTRLTKTTTLAVRARYAKPSDDLQMLMRQKKPAKTGHGILRSSRHAPPDDKAVRFRETPESAHIAE